MGRITLYLDSETKSKMKVAARSAGVSQSRWVADLIREKTATTRWPESFVKLVGTWSDDDFPSLEEIRAEVGATDPGQESPHYRSSSRRSTTELPG